MKLKALILIALLGALIALVFPFLRLNNLNFNWPWAGLTCYSCQVEGEDNDCSSGIQHWDQEDCKDGDVCYKMVFTSEDEDGYEEEWTERGCVFHDEMRCFEDSKKENHSFSVCYCNSNYCNGGRRSFNSFGGGGGAVFIAGGAALFGQRHYYSYL